MSIIPSAVKDVLTSTGYNSALSILQIDEEKLITIEKYADENCRNVIDSFKEYSNKKPFTFLPGHRECIFGIKAEILNLQNNKKSKSVINVEDIRLALEVYLSNFANKNTSLGITDFSTAIQHITLTKTGPVQAFCSFQCPICKSTVSIPFQSHWKLSNLLRHLNKHTIENQKTNIENPSENRSKNGEETVFVSVSDEIDGQNDEVDDVEQFE